MSVLRGASFLDLYLKGIYPNYNYFLKYLLISKLLFSNLVFFSIDLTLYNNCHNVKQIMI